VILLIVRVAIFCRAIKIARNIVFFFTRLEYLFLLFASKVLILYFKLFRDRTILYRIVVIKRFGLLAVVAKEFIKTLFHLLEQIYTVKATFDYSVLRVFVIGKW